MTVSDVVSRLLAKLDEVEKDAPKLHKDHCGLVLGSISGNLNDECDCGVPESVLRLCRAHRDIIAMFPVSAPHLDTEGCFYGFQSRDCGEHRTVGPHRAWCFDCSEWCYPTEPCLRCHGVSDVIKALAAGYGIQEEGRGDDHE